MAIVVVVSLLLGLDPLQTLAVVSGSAPETSSRTAPASDAGSDEQSAFVSVVLASTETVWGELLPGYQEPRLVLFSDAVSSACGYTSAAVGPFYCPGDRQVYLDLSFFRQLSRQLGAPGDFAQAYVIAHEVGHHVQTLLGTEGRLRSLQRRASEAERNRLSVAMELQADCYAGVWAHHARSMLEPGDIEEGLRAAAAIGDDTIQKRSQGYTVPESFTHGTAQQRVDWLRRGLQSGDPSQCVPTDLAVVSR